MSDACTSPVPFAELVDYWSDDLADADVERIDEHVLACGRCAAESAAVARIVQALRAMIPPVVSAAHLRELASRGLVVEENPVGPGDRKPVVFPTGVDILLHRLHGLDLAAAIRVRVVVRSESSGEVMHEDPDAPFDRDRGEVLIACQRHFASMPPDVLFEVHAQHGHGEITVVHYAVPHVLAPQG